MATSSPKRDYQWQCDYLVVSRCRCARGLVALYRSGCPSVSLITSLTNPWLLHCACKPQVSCSRAQPLPKKKYDRPGRGSGTTSRNAHEKQHGGFLPRAPVP